MKNGKTRANREELARRQGRRTRLTFPPDAPTMRQRDKYRTLKENNIFL